MQTTIGLIASDIVIERDTKSGMVWLTQMGRHFPFPAEMVFSLDMPIADLLEEGYMPSDATYGLNPLVEVAFERADAGEESLH